MTEESLALLIDRTATMTEAAMRGYYSEDEDIRVLLDSERYSLFAGGKRIRQRGIARRIRRPVAKRRQLCHDGK